MLLKDRRIGKFRIDFDTITNRADIARAVLRDVIVFRAETIWSEGALLYEGIHPDFDINAPMEEIAFYSAVVAPDGDGYRVQWIKQDPWVRNSHVLVVKEKAA